MKTLQFDPDRFLELYRAGLSDYKIAREIGCSATTVNLHRRKLGLPPNIQPVNDGKFIPCGERLPDRLRPRLRLLLLALKTQPDGKAWMCCWQYFRRLEGRPAGPAWGDRP